MMIISLIAIFLMFRLRFKRFSIYLWLVSGLICLLWELYLFTTGSRNYNFLPALELPYHALTEAGPGLIIMILFAHKIKIIDISEYSDDYKEKPLGNEISKGITMKKHKPKTQLEEPEDELDQKVEEDLDTELTEE